MTSAVNDALSHDVQRVDVQTLTEHRSPVDNDAAYHVVLEYNVLNRVAVEDCSAGVYCVIEQGRGALHRVDGIESVLELLIVDVEVLDDVHCLFLNDNLIEHHSATPHATAGRELAVELCYL